MYESDLDKKIIELVVAKSKLKISAIERKFGIPKNILHNTRIVNVKIPEIHRTKLVDYLNDENKIDSGYIDRLTPKKIKKAQYPVWFVRLKKYVKDNNITTDDLIETHRRVNSKPH